MVQRTHVVLVDDLDGSEGTVDTVKFSLDGARYEIDLNEEHVKELRETLAPFVGAARKVGGSPRKKPTGRGRKSTKSTAQIRQWARDHQIDVPPRGRIPKRVMEAYEAA